MLKSNKLGYTLAEIVTVTAVIGSLAAIAYPNYVRIRTNVNLELVKQNLRVIGEEMNEIYNKTHKYPAIEQILDSEGEEEIAITASLNAIDKKGFIVKDGTPANGSVFLHRIEPKPSETQIPKDKCFINQVDGIKEIDCSDAAGIGMSVIMSHPGASILSQIASDPSLTELQKTFIVSGWMVNQADYLMGTYEGVQGMTRIMDMLSRYGAIPALHSYVQVDNISDFERLFQKSHDFLNQNGIGIYRRYEGSPVSASQSFGGPNALWMAQHVVIGFDIDDQTMSNSNASLSKAKQAYDDWVSNQQLGA